MKNESKKTTAKNGTGAKATVKTVSGMPIATIHDIMTPELTKALAAFKEWAYTDDVFQIQDACNEALIYDNRAGVYCSMNGKEISGGGTWTIHGKKKIIAIKEAFAGLAQMVDTINFLPDGTVTHTLNKTDADVIIGEWEPLIYEGEILKNIFAVPMFWRNISESGQFDPYEASYYCRTYRACAAILSAMKDAYHAQYWRISCAFIATINKQLPAAKLENTYKGTYSISVGGAAAVVYNVNFYCDDCGGAKYIQAEAAGKTTYIDITTITSIVLYSGE